MFLRGLLGYLPVNAVQGLAGFAAITIFTRLLSPSEYGYYALAFALASVLQTLCFTWLEASMFRFQAGEEEQGGSADHIATIYGLALRVGGLFTVVSGLVIMLAPLSTELRVGLAVATATVVARTLFKLAGERRRAMGDVRGFAALELTQTIGALVLGTALAVVGAGGAAPLAGLGLAALLGLAWAAPKERKQARGGRFEAARIKRYLGYGVPLSLSLIMSLVLTTTDRFLLAHFLDEATVGGYHAGYSLSSRTLDVFFMALGMAAVPAAIAAYERGGRGALNIAARQQAGVMLALGLPAAVGLALVAQPLSQVMIGAELQPLAARVTPWIAAGAVFSGFTTHYFNQAFILSGQTSRLLVAMAFPAVANVLLNLWLIPRHGVDGAMWATTASFALGAVASCIVGRGALPLPIPWSTLGGAAAAAGIMAAVVSLAPAWGGLPELVFKAALGAFVYGAAAMLLNVAGVRRQGVAMLRRRVAERKPASLPS